MTIHQLKCWPESFDEMDSGLKTHEFRKNDRDFKVGDILQLRRWSPNLALYTGSTMLRTVTYVGQGFGIPEGFVCMSVAVVPRFGATGELIKTETTLIGKIKKIKTLATVHREFQVFRNILKIIGDDGNGDDGNGDDGNGDDGNGDQAQVSAESNI